ncbi:hypothetical protein Bca101_068056 [Brassica carinata]
MLSIEGHYYMEAVVGRALELAYMCLREDANAMSTVKEVVQALDNIVRFIARKKKKESMGYGRGVELEKKAAVAVNSPKETTRMLSVNEIEVEVEEEEDLERERAIADAKNWAETMRALRTNSNEKKPYSCCFENLHQNISPSPVSVRDPIRHHDYR